MKKRHQQIIQFLLENPEGITGRRLAELCNVTSRTIRTDIAVMNSCGKYHIIADKQLGYRIEKRHALQKDELSQSTYPSSRLIYIFQRLFEGAVSIDELINTLYISKATLQTDISKIKKLISTYPDLKLVRQKGSLSLNGSEFVKRKLYKNLLSTERNQPFQKEHIAQWYVDIPFNECVEVLEQVLKKHNYAIRQEAKLMLFIHFGILVDRISKQQYIKSNTFDEQGIIEWSIAQEIFTKIQKFLPLEVPSDEISALAHLIECYQTEFMLKDNLYLSGKNENVAQLVQYIVRQAYVYSGIDFSKDSEFINGMHLHLQGLLKRLDRGNSLPNPLVDNIKQQHSLVFDMAVFVCQSLGQQLGVSINENEIAFIALHLGVSYGRMAQTRKVQVLIVANTNVQFINLIEQKLLSIFNGKIEIVAHVTNWEDSWLDIYDIDLVISLNRMTDVLPIPIVFISGFITAAEERYIFDKIQQIERQRLLTDFSVQIEALLNEQFYYHQLNCQTKEEVIQYMCTQLVERNVVPKEYINAVLQREEMSSTSFQQGFALPHALFNEINQSIISIATLEKPIEWGSYSVQLVILLVLSESDRSLIPLLFEGLLGLIGEKFAIQKLVNSPNATTFLQYIIN